MIKTIVYSKIISKISVIPIYENIMYIVLSLTPEIVTFNLPCNYFQIN